MFLAKVAGAAKPEVSELLLADSAVGVFLCGTTVETLTLVESEGITDKFDFGRLFMVDVEIMDCVALSWTSVVLNVISKSLRAMDVSCLLSLDFFNVLDMMTDRLANKDRSGLCLTSGASSGTTSFDAVTVMNAFAFSVNIGVFLVDICPGTLERRTSFVCVVFVVVDKPMVVFFTSARVGVVKILKFASSFSPEGLFCIGTSVTIIDSEVFKFSPILERRWFKMVVALCDVDFSIVTMSGPELVVVSSDVEAVLSCFRLADVGLVVRTLGVAPAEALNVILFVV